MIHSSPGSPDAAQVFDRFAYWDAGRDGPVRRNVLEIWSRGTPISAEHAEFFARLGHGFSVFHLGAVRVPPGVEAELASKMAAALPLGTDRGTVVQLVRQCDPRLCSVRQRADPTHYLVVWGQCDSSAADLATQQLAQAAEALTEASAEASAEESFTYEKLAASSAAKSQMQASSQYRAHVAAACLSATGLVPETDIFSVDRSILYSCAEAATCRIDVCEQYVRLVQDYNTQGQACACVWHGPSSGTTLYTRTGQHRAHESSRGPEAAGAPTCDGLELGLDSTCSVSTQQLCEALERLADNPQACEAEGSLTAVGGHSTNPGNFSNLASRDELYRQLRPLSYEVGFADHDVVRCSTVACAMTGPFDRVSGKLYGCLPVGVASWMRHAAPAETHLFFADTPESRTALTEVSPGRAAYVFMNQATAELRGDTVVGYSVPLADLRRVGQFGAELVRGIGAYNKPRT